MRVSHEIKNNQIIYNTVLKDQINGDNEASLRIRYTFYPKTIKREFFISNDWVSSPQASQMTVYFQTQMFVPLNDFVLKSNQTMTKRHIYPSLDSVVLEGNFQDLYVHHRNKGIYLKSEPTAPYPFELEYSGSTLYNMSIIVLSQSDSIKPGATLPITQFLSLGDEVTAEKNILDQEGISLSNYPEGILPIIFSGYRPEYPDIRFADSVERGYQVLQEENIPYSEVVILDKSEEGSGTQNTTRIAQNVTSSNSIIGSASTGIKFFDDLSTQEQTVSSLIDYANDNGLNLIGYMPGSMNYNLDTLKIISDKKIPFILSNLVTPPLLWCLWERKQRSSDGGLK